MLNPFKSKEIYESESSRLAMEACEQIISEMGAEIHDDLIQKLSVLRLNLDRLEKSKTEPAQIESLIAIMNADFLEIVTSIRRISRRLLPAKMENDSFQKGINVLCQNMERPGGGTIHLEIEGSELPLPELAERYLFRMIQELIHNAIRHSSAWHIWIRLKWTKQHLIIEVEDDGTGFSKISEAVDSLNKKHNTLRMRSKVIGASIQYTAGQKGLLAKLHYKISIV